MQTFLQSSSQKYDSIVEELDAKTTLLQNNYKSNYDELFKKYAFAKFRFDQFYKYQKWLIENYPTSDKLAQEVKEIEKFYYQPKISVLIPIYKTPVDLLRKCIESVFDQSYCNWEICAVDDMSDRPELAELLKEYADQYKEKFSYRIRTTNGHISVASNDALKLAKGEFIALLDHDDVLWPNAFYEVIKCLNADKKIDFIYSDEDKLEDGLVHDHPYNKPSFNESFLAGCNYITHLALIRTNLVRSIGGFRKGLEGAQDWDLFLRLLEKTNRVHHIPKILYSWRVIETSTAKGGFTAKPYAYEAQKKAVLDYYERKKIPVNNADLPTGYAGWKMDFKVADSNIGIVINDLHEAGDIYSLLRAIEGTNLKSFRRKYYLLSNLTIEQLSLKDKDFIDNLEIHISAKVPTRPSYGMFAKLLGTEYVLILSGISDLHGQDSWLNNLVGYANMESVTFVTPQIRYKDHTISSAGLAFNSSGCPVRLLDHYFRDYDQRLDTNLLSPREVALPDPRALLYKVKNLTEPISKLNAFVDLRVNQRRVIKTIYSPFLCCFLKSGETASRDVTRALDKGYGYNIEVGSRFWGRDYLSLIEAPPTYLKTNTNNGHRLDTITQPLTYSHHPIQDFQEQLQASHKHIEEQTKLIQHYSSVAKQLKHEISQLEAKKVMRLETVIKKHLKRSRT